jgi:hypothetical protein
MVIGAGRMLRRCFASKVLPEQLAPLSISQCIIAYHTPDTNQDDAFAHFIHNKEGTRKRYDRHHYLCDCHHELELSQGGIRKVRRVCTIGPPVDRPCLCVGLVERQQTPWASENTGKYQSPERIRRPATVI